MRTDSLSVLTEFIDISIWIRTANIVRIMQIPSEGMDEQTDRARDGERAGTKDSFRAAWRGKTRKKSGTRLMNVAPKCVDINVSE